MTSQNPQEDDQRPEPRSPKDAADLAQARFWDDVVVNEAESHVAAVHRDRLLAARRAAMHRVGEARQALAYARQVGDAEMIAIAVADLQRAGGDYKRIRDDVAEQMRRIIQARLARMAAMAEHLGDAAEAGTQWLSTWDVHGDDADRDG